MRTDRLQQAMEDKGFNQTALAEAVGATQGAIQQILSGATKKSRLLPEIADKLEVSVYWLLGTSDERRSALPAAELAPTPQPSLPLPTETQLAEVLAGLLPRYAPGAQIDADKMLRLAKVLRETLGEYAANPANYPDSANLRTLAVGWSNLSLRQSA